MLEDGGMCESWGLQGCKVEIKQLKVAACSEVCRFTQNLLLQRKMKFLAVKASCRELEKVEQGRNK
jgi:hypothetical protein